MVDEKSKQLNVRVSEALYNRLKDEAEAQGVPLAERVRQLLENETQTERIADNDSYIDDLKAQITYLHDDIQAKRNENTQLLRLLDQQQQLQLTTSKRIELLETELKIADDPDTKKWWQKIF